MELQGSQPVRKGLPRRVAGGFYRLIALRAHTSIMLGALSATVLGKLFHAHRMNLVNELPTWVLIDVAVLLAVELVMALVIFARPTRRVRRLTTGLAAILCTWSVLNVGWIVRSGAQLPPSLLKPLLRDPLNTLAQIGGNIYAMPRAAAVVLLPSFTALGIYFYYLANPLAPDYNARRFRIRVVLSVLIIAAAAIGHNLIIRRGDPNILSAGMRFSSHFRAVRSLVMRNTAKLTRADYEQAVRELPTGGELNAILNLRPRAARTNVIIVVLEGIQYNYTSPDGRNGDLTPHLAEIAGRGVLFSGMRSTLTHTTKALFALLTGRYPSISNDLAETVPIDHGYGSLATILKGKLNYRTAFFQSAKGNFEARPGLIHNLGFDSFWARDFLEDPNTLRDPESFVGYLACDEFALLDPLKQWIRAGEQPFFIAYMCSVTHDPYEVPQWFAEPARDPVERYKQTIAYTDSFLKALDSELSALDLADNTLLCIVGDHGEAFGEHGLHGHEMNAFDEALRVPWVMRAPSLIQPGTRVQASVSSIDVAPTLLELLGVETHWAGFDGLNVLGPIPANRKVYFSGWIDESPAGFVRNNGKFVYHSEDHVVRVFDLAADPNENMGVIIGETEAEPIARDIISWCRNSVLKIDQKRTGNTMLFDVWRCRWNARVSDVDFDRQGLGNGR